MQTFQCLDKTNTDFQIFHLNLNRIHDSVGKRIANQDGVTTNFHTFSNSSCVLTRLAVAIHYLDHKILKVI